MASPVTLAPVVSTLVRRKPGERMADADHQPLYIVGPEFRT
ncbi:hypothetical protein [Haloarchaeobius amylolyticus]|nr:hypothetical protein [Haloarchaeobius amylolyticus]